MIGACIIAAALGAAFLMGRLVEEDNRRKEDLAHDEQEDGDDPH